MDSSISSSSPWGSPSPSPSDLKHSRLTVIRSIGTATPPFRLDADGTIKTLDQLGDGLATQDFLQSVVSNGLIENRYGVVNLAAAETLENVSRMRLEDRYSIYRDSVAPLVTAAAKSAFAEAHVTSSDITGAIFVTNTGFAVPDMELLLFNDLGLPPTASFFNITGMGCGAGIAGLRLADEQCRSRADSKILLVVVDISSIHATPLKSKLDVILHSIFADGCAVAVLDSSSSLVPGCPCIDDTFCQLLPNSRKGIELSVDSTSVKCVLSPQLSDMIATGLGSVISQHLSKHSLTLSDIDHWAVHPGGRRILEAAQTALELSDTQVKTSYEILKQHGNMLAPSVLFVMKRMVEELHQQPASNSGTPGSLYPTVTNGVALSFSPGVRVEAIKFLLSQTPIKSEVPLASKLNGSSSILPVDSIHPSSIHEDQTKNSTIHIVATRVQE